MTRFHLSGKGLIDTVGGFSICTSCGRLPPHVGCEAICAACVPPTGGCYCWGCTVAGKGCPPPDGWDRDGNKIAPTAPKTEEPVPQSCGAEVFSASGIGMGTCILRSGHVGPHGCRVPAPQSKERERWCGECDKGRVYDDALTTSTRCPACRGRLAPKESK